MKIRDGRKLSNRSARDRETNGLDGRLGRDEFSGESDAAIAFAIRDAFAARAGSPVAPEPAMALAIADEPTPVGGEVLVNSYTTSFQGASSLAALTDGGFVVTWSSLGQDGSSFGIYAQRYAAHGNPDGAEFRVNTYTTSDQSLSSVAALADGGFVVTWSSSGQDGSFFGIYAQRYTAAGSPDGAEFRVNSYTNSEQTYSSVAALADGGFVVTWSSFGQDGDGHGIYAQRYTAAGSPDGAEFRVNTYTVDAQFLSSVAALADGGFVVTWSSFSQDGSDYGIYAQRYAAGGSAAGGEFRVNTFTASAQFNSSVAALADGGFLVTWTSAGQDGSGLGIYAQRFDSAGGAVGGEFLINETVAGGQVQEFVPRQAVRQLSDDSVAITWQGNGAGDADGVFVRRFSVTVENALPAGADKTIAIYEDGSHTFSIADFGFVDADAGDTLQSVRIATLPASGTLTLDGNAVAAGEVIAAGDIGGLVFTPAPDANGDDYAGFTFQVSDGVDEDASPDTITFDVVALNDAPVADLNGADAGIDDSRGFDEGGGIQVAGALTVSDADGDMIIGARITLTDPVAGDELAYSFQPLPEGIEIDAVNSTGSMIILTGAATAAEYALALGRFFFFNNSDDPTLGGTDDSRTITVIVNDGQVESAPATLTVTIRTANDDGVAEDDAGTVAENGTVDIAVLANDSDPDGPAPSVAEVAGTPLTVGDSVSLLSGARVTRNADGTLTYDTNGAFGATPAAGSGASNTPASDSFTYTLAGGGTATVALTIIGIDSNDTLVGTPVDDILLGASGNDVIQGLSGSDRLDGGPGADRSEGGLGDDWHYIHNAADQVIELSGEGNDRVFASVSYALGAGQSIETLSTTSNAGTGAIGLTGNELGQVIIGNAGANVLTGGGGGDVLIGFGGNDTLVGSADAPSTLQGGLGNDIYRVFNASDTVLEFAGEGTDRIYAAVSFVLLAGREIESVFARDPDSTAPLDLTGNAFGQTLWGNAGENVLVGGGGADYLIGGAGNDILFGNADANSTLQGGTGDDRYYVSRTGDSIVEFAGEGNDRVLASISYTLTAGKEIEELSTANLAGTTALNLTGNAFAQTIIGNNGANILSGAGGADNLAGFGGNDILVGGDGNDILNGGAGYDIMNGGAGADIFIYANPFGPGLADRIQDFAPGLDRIFIDNALFTGLPTGALAANAFRTGTAALDADDRIIYNPATGQLFFDADGNGAGAAVQFGVLSGAPALAASDFTVI